MDHKQEAKTLLQHYFEQAGISLDGRFSDCGVEIAEIVDHIIEAAKTEVWAELAQHLPQRVPDGEWPF